MTRASASDDCEVTVIGAGPYGLAAVLLGTGYRIDIAKLGVTAPELLERIACRRGSLVLAAGRESSAPELHFVGASVVDSHGPPTARRVAPDPGMGPAA